MKFFRGLMLLVGIVNGIFNVNSNADSGRQAGVPEIRVLFLGGPVDPGGCCHIPYPRYTRLHAEMLKVGIRVDYAPGRIDQRDHVGLTDDSLKSYDVLFTYNTGNVEPVIDPIYRFVESGKGLVAVHLSIINGGLKWYKLLGARFSDHGWGDPIKLSYMDENHGAMKGVPRVIPFKDETYHFWDLANDRIVLQKLEDGGDKTWVRKQGLGSVYYTGAGHQFPADTVGVWETWEFMKQMEVAIKWIHAQNPKSVVTLSKHGSLSRESNTHTRRNAGRVQVIVSEPSSQLEKINELDGRVSLLPLPKVGRQ